MYCKAIFNFSDDATLTSNNPFSSERKTSNKAGLCFNSLSLSNKIDELKQVDNVFPT